MVAVMYRLRFEYEEWSILESAIEEWGEWATKDEAEKARRRFSALLIGCLAIDVIERQ
jgi:hypothetical protein